MTKKILTRSLAAAALAAVLGGAVVQFAPPGTMTSSVALAAGWTDAPATGPVKAGPDFAAIVERFGAAVVNVRVEGSTRQASDDASPFRGPPREFGRRFGMPDRPDARPTMGVGSGFIVEADGLILTNAHVVSNARTVTVKLADQREFPAKVVGLDRATDIAVLKIEARGLPTVAIGDPARLHVGEWVLAIGSPYGFENTATAGIVSATARALPNQSYVPFIQTDVPVNPGNSGGPLFNNSGEVIGVNSQIYSDTGGYQGLSFAIPIDVAMKIGKQLAATGKVQRGWIGASIQDVTQPLADAFGLKKPGGALISGVEKDGPAARAGLQSGDVILKVGDAVLGRSGELPPRIADIAPGTRTTLQVWRQGATKEIAIEIGEKAAKPVAGDVNAPVAQGKLGLSVRPLSPDEARSINERGGLVVEQVSGPAERAGIEPGDVVLALNGETVSTIDELRALAAKARDRAALLILRDDARLFIPLNLG